MPISNDNKSIPSVYAVLASYNRKFKTLSALRCLYASAANAPINLEVVLVDDASDDGTPQTVARDFPDVEIIHGAGELYWNQGMRLAIKAALKHSLEYILLLNDDTLLDEDALARLMGDVNFRDSTNTIWVATIRDPETGLVTYGGRSRSSLFNVLRFDKVVEPDPGNMKPCDTFNANCVLVPKSVLDTVGNLAAEFRHRAGDYDYGLRAKAAGVRLLVAPGTYGVCSKDSGLSKPDINLGLVRDLVYFSTNPKEWPIKERIYYYKRHGGLMWWFFVFKPYAGRVIRYINLKMKKILNDC